MNIRILMVALSLLTRAALADMSGIITTVEEIYPGYTQTGNAFWYSGSVSYVNGGVTFTFPTDLFTENPTIIVSVSSETYSSSGTLTALVTALDTTSATVRVNVGTLTAIGEAETDSVMVHVWAVGAQN